MKVIIPKQNSESLPSIIFAGTMIVFGGLRLKFYAKLQRLRLSPISLDRWNPGKQISWDDENTIAFTSNIYFGIASMDGLPINQSIPFYSSRPIRKAEINPLNF